MSSQPTDPTHSEHIHHDSLEKERELRASYRKRFCVIVGPLPSGIPYNVFSKCWLEQIGILPKAFSHRKSAPLFWDLALGDAEQVAKACSTPLVIKGVNVFIDDCVQDPQRRYQIRELPAGTEEEDIVAALQAQNASTELQVLSVNCHSSRFGDHSIPNGNWTVVVRNSRVQFDHIILYGNKYRVMVDNHPSSPRK